MRACPYALSLSLSVLHADAHAAFTCRIAARDGSVGVRCGLTGELARTFAEGGSLEALSAALRDTHGRDVARAQAETRALVTKAKTLSRRGQVRSAGRRRSARPKPSAAAIQLSPARSHRSGG